MHLQGERVLGNRERSGKDSRFVQRANEHDDVKDQHWNNDHGLKRFVEIPSSEGSNDQLSDDGCCLGCHQSSPGKLGLVHLSKQNVQCDASCLDPSHKYCLAWPNPVDKFGIQNEDTCKVGEVCINQCAAMTCMSPCRHVYGAEHFQREHMARKDKKSGALVGS
jgi:hypothetical protein